MFDLNRMRNFLMKTPITWSIFSIYTNTQKELIKSSLYLESVHTNVIVNQYQTTTLNYDSNH